MAVVNLLLPAFGIVWAENGTVEAIDEAQWRAGWAFIGSTPPSVEQFNKLTQVQDQKSNWLYGQVKAITDAAGVDLSAGVLTSLRDAIWANSTQHLAVVTATGNWTVPAGVRSLDVEVWAGGGGGGGVGSTSNGTASGGGGGGYARGVLAVTPGQIIACTVGVGGAAGSAGNTGGAGGGSSFGSFLSATGGAGGGPNTSGSGGAGGTGTGGAIQGVGAAGGGGLPVGTSGLGAPGGGAPYGGPGGNGAPGSSGGGTIPGGGGGGPGSAAIQAGAAGARGQINIKY